MPRVPERAALDVLRFWFGDVDDWSACVARNYRRWFERGRDLDGVVRDRFGALLESASGGACDGWCETPRGALALILVLDQFPRHVHRGGAAAFASDARARAVCETGVDAGLDVRLTPVERSFFYLPLQHAEDLDAQRRSVGLYAACLEECERSLSVFFEKSLQSAEIHHDLVARFGRFPHRNDALGRESTAEERAFLAAGAARFGQ